MSGVTRDIVATSVLPVSRLDDLFKALIEKGFSLIGPVVRDGAINYAPIESVDNLPKALTDQQMPGKYRLESRQDEALFGYNVGPVSWKNFIDPPRRRLWRTSRDSGAVVIEELTRDSPKYAFIGVRACDISAIRAHHAVHTQNDRPDPDYAARHDEAFVVAVNCTEAGGTCFCTSMGTGPRCRHGYDLALTEVIDNTGHSFVMEAGSQRGQHLANELNLDNAPASLVATAVAKVDSAAQSMSRSIETTGIKNLLYGNDENPRWNDVAARCLCCSNCTMVCPTCFCSNVEDVTDLSGAYAERWKSWDSCFNLNHSYLHGGAVRTSGKSRYRQWLTHKFASWIDQFGTSGCTGCGRCITWCPVGIDVTEELAAIRSTDVRSKHEENGGEEHAHN